VALLKVKDPRLTNSTITPDLAEFRGDVQAFVLSNLSEIIRKKTAAGIELTEAEYYRAKARRVVDIGVRMVGPVLLAFGDTQRRERVVPTIVDSSELWCQGYSEPGAVSDLSSLKQRPCKIATSTASKVLKFRRAIDIWQIACSRSFAQATRGKAGWYLNLTNQHEVTGHTCLPHSPNRWWA